MKLTAEQLFGPDVQEEQPAEEQPLSAAQIFGEIIPEQFPNYRLPEFPTVSFLSNSDLEKTGKRRAARGTISDASRLNSQIFISPVLSLASDNSSSSLLQPASYTSLGITAHYE